MVFKESLHKVDCLSVQAEQIQYNLFLRTEIMPQTLENCFPGTTQSVPLPYSLYLFFPILLFKIPEIGQRLKLHHNYFFIHIHKTAGVVMDNL